jgi:hypothetical protein
MSKPFRTYIYHATEEPKVVLSDEAEEYYEKGWADTPAKFKTAVEITGADLDDKEQVEQAEKAVEGVKDSINGALNLDLMNVKQLKSYAQKHYGKKFKGNVSKKTALTEIKKLALP